MLLLPITKELRLHHHHWILLHSIVRWIKHLLLLRESTIHIRCCAIARHANLRGNRAARLLQLMRAVSIVTHVPLITEIVPLKELAQKSLVVGLTRREPLLVPLLPTVLTTLHEVLLRVIWWLLPLPRGGLHHTWSSSSFLPLILHLAAPETTFLFVLTTIPLVGNFRINENLLVRCLQKFLLRYRLKKN